ncbi:MAG TPA: hypothetical protein VNS79_11030 [Sphingobium sp.]|nr:hypothetical protein [Sphingobium sp.]
MSSFRKQARSVTLGLLLAGALFTAPSLAIAQAAFTTLDRTSEARVSFSASERGKPIQAGSDVSVAGQGFKPGQQVTLLYGAAPLPGGPLTANAEGKLEGRIVIPADAISGTHPILVVAQGPYHATVADLKVSPTIPLSGQAGYVVTEAQATRGLYQSAYSTKHNTLFATSAIGRPPVKQSEIVKLDADTLKVLARVTPAEAPTPTRAAAPGNAAGSDGPGLYAVYGIGLDDARDMVWVTNSRQNTIAVYRQSDLALVKQFAPNTVTHPRDAAVDAAAGKAYVSATGKPEVVMFDTGSLEAVKTIEIKALGRGKEFSATSLSLDAKAHRLYVVSLSTSEVAIINTQTDTVEKVLPVPGARSTIGVSHDPQTGRIFVAAQGSDNLVVLDGNTGAVIADTPIGAGALNVVFDPVKRLAYVSNRGAGTIAVTDADGKIVANLGPAPSANHVSLGKNGTVFAVDKSANARGDDSDTILRIRPRS